MAGTKRKNTADLSESESDEPKKVKRPRKKKVVQTDEPPKTVKRPRKKKLKPTPVLEPVREGCPILTLNDDCVKELFKKKLSINDVSALSQTCERFNTLAVVHFSRSFREKVMIINGVTDDGELDVGPIDERYIECFEKHVQNVVLDADVQNSLKQLRKIYRDPERAKMKAVKFDDWDKLSRKNGIHLANVLSDVETVTLFKTEVDGDLNKCLLRHMPNMKCLTLLKEFYEPDDVDLDWIDRNYPNLEEFAWHLDEALSIPAAESFLGANPQISHFSLLAKETHTLDSLLEESITVHELFYELSSAADLKKLQALCDDKICHSLHLKFPDSYHRSGLADRLIPLEPYISGLYFEKEPLTESFMTTISTFDKLKVLQMTISNKIECLKPPNLEEVYVYWCVTKANFGRYKKALIHLFQLPTMKKVFFRNNAKPFGSFKFDMLNKKREEVDGASVLKIYFKTEETDGTGRLNDIRRYHSKIQVERVETENIDNPLVNEYLVWKNLTEAAKQHQFKKAMQTYSKFHRRRRW